jgi:hypothetical protein
MAAGIDPRILDEVTVKTMVAAIAKLGRIVDYAGSTSGRQW